MPSASRRKAKQAKKIKTLTTPNHHSSPAVHLQGAANHSKKMEGSLNGTFQDTQKVKSLSENKEVVVEVAVDDDDRSLGEAPDGEIAITDEEATQSEEKKELIESGKVEETEVVSESVADSFEPDAIKDAQVDNIMASDTVELEVQGKDFLSPDPTVANVGVKETELAPSEDNNELSSVSGNEGLRETEVVETIIKDMTVAEEEKNVLSSVVTDKLLREGEEPNEIYGNSSLPPIDVALEETVETSILKSDESDKVPLTIIEKSLEPYMDEKIGEPSDVQEESSYESAKESFQLSPNVPDTESTSATVQDKTEVPGSTENPTIVPLTQRQYASWKSCCGLFEIMRGGDR